MSAARVLAALADAVRAAAATPDDAEAVGLLVDRLQSLGVAGAALMTETGQSCLGCTARPLVACSGAAGAESLARWRAMWRHDPRPWPQWHSDGGMRVRALELNADGALAGVLYVAVSAAGTVSTVSTDRAAGTDTDGDADVVTAVEVLAGQIEARLTASTLRRRDDVQAARLRRLDGAAVALGRSLDEREVLRELARQLRGALPVRGLVVACPDDSGELVVAARFEGADELPDGIALPAGGVEGEMMRRAALTARAVREDDPGRPEAPAVIAAPMLVGRTLIAVVLARGVEPFGAADEELLRTMGAQAATAIVNARLYADSERERRQSEALADVARAVGASLRIDEVLALTLRHAAALLRSDGGFVALRSGSYLEIVAADGHAEALQGMWLPGEGSLAGGVLQSGEAVIANDAAACPEVFLPAQRIARARRIVVVPLTSATGPIGVLAVVSRAAPFVDADARVLQRLGDHAAVAIVNARLFEEVVERTREWAVAFDAVGRGMALIDPQGRVTRCNARAAQLVGVDAPAQLVGRPLLAALLGPEEAESAASVLAPALRDAVDVRGTVRAPESGRLFELLAAPHPHGGAVVTFDDVTGAHERALALARSEASYARLVDAAPDGICTMDAEGRLTSANPALEHAARRPASELLGRPVTSLVPPGERDTVRELWATAMSGRRARGELRFRDPDGRQHVGAVLAAPITEGDTVVGVLAIVRDVTDERLLAAQLLQQEKLAAVGQLVSGVAHELNNPLAAVMAFSQLLLADPDEDPEQRYAAEVIDAEARRAARIVANLLTFARQHEPERTLVDLNDVMRTVVELRRYSLRAHGVELALELDPDMPPTLADEQQLLQVVLNLVTNAEHALQGWAGPRRLELVTRRAGAWLVATVRDSGPGIEAGHLGRIFDPFYTTKPVGQGTGLGLSISDGIVREHGGRLTAESASGGGATFTLELPLVATDPEERSAAPASEGPASGAARPAPADGEGAGTTAAGAAPARAALVVDDEPALRLALSRLLELEGYAVDTAEDGVAALERLASRRYDVVLLDVRMPRLGGDETYERLRARDPDQAARVLFVTGDVRSDRTRLFLEASGRPAIAKPFRFEDMCAAVAAVVATGEREGG